MSKGVFKEERDLVIYGINVVQERIKELTADLPNETMTWRKWIMQKNLKEGETLVFVLKKRLRDMELGKYVGNKV